MNTSPKARRRYLNAAIVCVAFAVVYVLFAVFTLHDVGHNWLMPALFLAGAAWYGVKARPHGQVGEQRQG